jgi:hypothetical protein
MASKPNIQSKPHRESHTHMTLLSTAVLTTLHVVMQNDSLDGVEGMLFTAAGTT